MCLQPKQKGNKRLHNDGNTICLRYSTPFLFQPPHSDELELSVLCLTPLTWFVTLKPKEDSLQSHGTIIPLLLLLLPMTHIQSAN